MNRRRLLGSLAVLPLAGCTSTMQTDANTATETEGASNTREDDNDFPPRAYRPEDVPDLLQRNEYNNWVTSAHLEVQTQLLREQNELLRELVDELKGES